MFEVECLECDYKSDLTEFYSFTTVEIEEFDGTQYVTIYFECPDCGVEVNIT